MPHLLFYDYFLVVLGVIGLAPKILSFSINSNLLLVVAQSLPESSSLLGFCLSSLGRAKSSHGEGNQHLSPSFLKLCADFHTT